MTRYPKFSDEEVRRQTYASWVNFMDPKKLSKAGLFFLGGGDMVQCFECGVILHDWKDTNIPKIEPLKHSSKCNFIRNKIKKDTMFSTELTIAAL